MFIRAASLNRKSIHVTGSMRRWFVGHDDTCWLQTMPNESRNNILGSERDAQRIDLLSPAHEAAWRALATTNPSRTRLPHECAVGDQTTADSPLESVAGLTSVPQAASMPSTAASVEMKQISYRLTRRAWAEVDTMLKAFVDTGMLQGTEWTARERGQWARLAQCDDMFLAGLCAGTKTTPSELEGRPLTVLVKHATMWRQGKPGNA